MSHLVDVGELSLELYERLLPVEIEGLRKAASELKGARVLHINATPYGGCIGASPVTRTFRAGFGA